MKVGSSQSLTSVTPGVSGDPDGLCYGSEGAERMWLQGNLFNTQAFGTSFAQRHKETQWEIMQRNGHTELEQRERDAQRCSEHTPTSAAVVSIPQPGILIIHLCP